MTLSLMSARVIQPDVSAPTAPPAGKLRVVQLFRPHWKKLALALAAVIGETLADVLEPWPVKVVIDNVLQSKRLPQSWAAFRFTLIALSVAPVMFVIVYFYTRRIRKASRAVRKQESELLSGVAEMLTSIQVVQAFAREDYEDRRFSSESRQSVRAALQARSMKAKLPPIIDVIVAVGTCLVLGYGAHLVLAGRLSTGVLIVFLLYLG